VHLVGFIIRIYHVARSPEFYPKNKFEKLVHLVDFIIRIYDDARSPERQNILVELGIHFKTLRTSVLCIWIALNVSVLESSFTTPFFYRLPRSLLLRGVSSNYAIFVNIFLKSLCAAV